MNSKGERTQGGDLHVSVTSRRSPAGSWGQRAPKGSSSSDFVAVCVCVCVCVCVVRARACMRAHMPEGHISSGQFISVTQSCATLCDPMNHSMPGLPVHHHLPEFTQTHVHRVRDAIQPSHPLFSPSPPAPNPSQHQSFPMSQLFA